MNFISSFKKQIFNITKNNFNPYCLDLFYFQARHNNVYKEYLESLKIKPDSINSIQEIPFLPISFFKSHKITINNTNSQTVFYSSGTTGITKSKHFISDINHYLMVAQTIFESIYSPLESSVVLAFLPSYQDNPNSSLIFMINHFIKESGSQLSSFVGSSEEIVEKVREAQKNAMPVVLFGVSFALLDLAEKGTDLSNVTIIETGGMKGRRKEIIRTQLHSLLKQGLKTQNIHSEYGMTELLSQAYSKGENFAAPLWMKVMTREVNDPFSNNSSERSGILKVIDLANVESCAFIETEDLGFVNDDGTFKVLGRVDNTEVRGCNLLYQG